ncbi:MAG TPA: DUF6596 domain-containing protein [Phenylobacterium sp.]|nr:DUF6596 domain-containing protein [Phenylobacterium sp.]
MTAAAEAALERAVREDGPRLRAALAARLRDLDAAEEALAFACAAAVEAWRRGGPPRDPAAWLYAAARRRAFDLARRADVRRRLRPDPPEPAPTPESLVLAAAEPIPDERLRLIFVCCHPALALESRAMLTLRVVCGLSVERLARAFLTTPAAATQRLTRAKRKIREARIPFETPDRAAWPERMAAVLATLEIAYAQAYEDAAAASDPDSLAHEALRLTGLLAELAPNDPEALGLAALVRLAESRRAARVGSDGGMVPLDRQEVRLWDARLIAEAADLLARAAGARRSGPYQVMAAIHAAHASRLQTGRTPHEAICELYATLRLMRPTPVVSVNQAAALAAAGRLDEARALLDALRGDGRLSDWPPYLAARAALDEATGDVGRAREALARAAELTSSPVERRFLQARSERL